jgi:hypothetical protein
MSADLSPDQFLAAELMLAPDQLMLRDGLVADHAVVIAGGKFKDVGPRAEFGRATPASRSLRCRASF